MKLATFFKSIGSDQSGATAVEYGLIVSLIVIAMVGALQGVAEENSNVWSRVQTAQEEASN
ncbi:Flp family type IVb pilin [Erythrobacter sp. F6033]|uniref:Flp family type IVb pilin n=1 Tax=Erythrobacter sp. F6033 TaxID=2926401 RepID=UPI001FF36042|nr:Flp family type IVb pilin [Erythrobacter sp. F6033]MCK0128591.1 Flp family type IVb pilin [Erythrobacter sp. F6033]